MKQRILSIVFAMAMLLSVGLLPVSAAEDSLESVTVTVRNEPSYVMDITEAGFEVAVKTTGEATAYTVEYDLAGKTYTDTLNVKANARAKKDITLQDPPLGNHELTVRVKDGERLVDEITTPIVLIRTYTPQFMDSYDKFGMCMHFMQPDQSQPYEYEMLEWVGNKGTRDEATWFEVEAKKGQYDFGHADELFQTNAEHGMYVFFATGYSNPAYVDTTRTSSWFQAPVSGLWFQMPVTRLEMEAYAQYVLDMVKRYNLKTIEVSNEPNWMILPEPNAANYVQTVKTISNAVKAYDPDVKVIAGAIANMSNAESYFTDMFRHGIAPYIDGVSFHPYITPKTADEGSREKLGMYNDVLREYGGWKLQYATEFGYTNAQNASHMSEESVAESLIKNRVYSDEFDIFKTFWYNFRNKGEVPDNSEHNFGMINRNYTPKPAYAVMSQMNNRLNGSVYVGKLDMGEGIEAHVYTKDKKPVLLMWTTDGTQSTFRAEGITAEDQVGNALDTTDGVKIQSQVTYIFGLSQDYIAKAAREKLTKGYAAWQEAWQDVFPGASAAAELAAAANGLTAVPLAADSAARLEENFAIGDAVIAAHAEGTLDVTNEEYMRMLYELYEMGYVWGILYGQAEDVASSSKLASDEAYAAAKALADSKTQVANMAKLPNTTDILNYSKLYNEMAHAAQTDSTASQAKTGTVAMYDLLSSKLAAWALAEGETEQADTSAAVFIYQTELVPTIYQGKEQDVKLSIDNQRGSDIQNATVGIYAQDGSVAWESDVVTIKNGQPLDMVAKIRPPEGLTEGDYEFIIKIKENGQEIVTKLLGTTIKSLVSAELQPVKTGIGTLKKLTVEVTNTYSQPVNMNVTLIPPEGWVLKEDTVKANIGAGKTKEVVFEVSKKVPTAFNQYVFEVQINDSANTASYSRKIPLDFLAVTQAGEVDFEGFTGDISDWANAYPIYLNPPEDPSDKAAWQAQNYAGRFFAKWDSENLYVLGDVYDDVWCQNNDGSNIWNGDSIQISIDGLNNKTEKYAEDDYEYTFSLTQSGPEVYAHYNAGGEVTPCPSDWVKIYRDDAQHITRYLVKLPKDALEPFAPGLGKEIGLNFVINDADEGDRANYFELRPGTSVAKNPSVYETFTLSKLDVGEPADDTNLTVSITPGAQPQPDPEPVETGFTDMKGHWAEEDVNAMAEQGIVEGKAEGIFAPEDSVTRAEFLAILSRGIGLAEAAYDGAYADVAEDAWYAGIVQAAQDEGLIPAEMTEDGMLPDQPITREEMAAIMVRALPDAAADGTAADFADADAISDWARDAVAQAAQLGLMQGKDDGLFAPDEGATRAEAATVLSRLLALL